jgi:hypothetical protein
MLKANPHDFINYLAAKTISLVKFIDYISHSDLSRPRKAFQTGTNYSLTARVGKSPQFLSLTRILLLVALCGLAAVAKASAPRPVVGTLDLATGGASCTVAGWSKDLNSTASTRVDLYMNAPFAQGGVYLASVMATILRTDLPYPDQNHGFNYTFPLSSAIYDGHPHAVYAYGIAISSTSSNALLNLSGKSVTCTTVNAKNYGATGNGLTDDAVALQNAINATPGGGSTYIPAGTYMLGTASADIGNVGLYPKVGTYPAAANCPASQAPIQSALKVQNTNVQVYGDGTTSTPTILMLMPNTKMRVISVVGTGSTAQNNVTIDNLVVDGNKVNRTAGPWPCGDTVDAMISGWEVNGLTISSIEARNGLEDGMGCWFCNRGGQVAGAVVSTYFTVNNAYSHDNGTFITVDGVNTNIGGTGISSSATANAQLTGNTIENNTSSGIWIAYGSNNVSIENNTIANSAKAAITLGGSPLEGASSDNNFTIASNTLSGNGQLGFAAIEINDVYNAVVSANQFSNNNAGIRANYTSTDIWIAYNTISASALFGVAVLCNSTVVSMTNNTINNNGVAPAVGSGGVQVGDATPLTTCATPDTASITTDTSSITTMTGNTIMNNGTSLLYQVGYLDSAASIGPSNWDTAAENTISFTAGP